MDRETYAELNKKIKEIQGDGIEKAVSEYLESNPTVLQDSLGLQIVDGQLCAVIDE